MTASASGEFTLLFQWPDGADGQGDSWHDLEAATLDQAMLEAAMLYAGAAFKVTPPVGYRILREGAEAYRYPPGHVRAAAA